MRSENCEFYGKECCLCSACQSMRKAVQEAEQLPKDEIEKVIKEAEDELKKFDE